jgi:cytochrome c-type biogenesis protein CcmH
MDQDLPALRRQLVQLKELHESGVLSATQYDESRMLLERRIVDLVMSGAADAPAPAAHPAAVTSAAAPASTVLSAAEAASPSRKLLAALAVVVVVVAAAGYFWMGSPSQIVSGPAGAAAGPEGAAAPHATSSEQIAAMVEKLAERMKEKPDDAEGWAMLARSYSVLGRHPEALVTYEKAIKLRGDDAQLLADYADSLAVKNDRKLAGEPMKWVDKALKLDPKNVKALALAGTHAFDKKDFAGAVKFWETAVEIGPADSGYVQQIKGGLAEARQLAGLPPKEDKPAVTAQAPGGAGAAPPAPSALVSAKAVSGNVTLSPAMAKLAGPDDTVFIFARAAEGARMPLAILRKQVKDLPVQFTLDDSLAMSPAAKISGAASVIVGARISKTGEALPKAGDLSGQAGPACPDRSPALGSTGVKIEISEQVK